MPRRRVTRAAAVLALLLIFVAGCGSGGAGTSGTGWQQGKVAVVAGFYPIEYFARRVGGERVDLFNPVPPGAEPHDLELSPRTLERMQQARVLLYLGHGFQPALDRALDTLKGDNLLVRDVSEGATLLAASGEEVAGSASVDPHIWLDPQMAKGMVAQIAGALSDSDPDGAKSYETNAATLMGELAQLDGQFSAGLKGCKRTEFITTHTAFAYLAKRYGLQQVAIAGLSPEAEPSPARLKEIIDFAKAHNVQYIFFETLAQPKVAEVIAQEVGAQTLVLNPIEGLTTEQAASGNDYFSLMRGNLMNLEKALECTK